MFAAGAFGATALCLCFASGGSLAGAGPTLACKGTMTLRGDAEPLSSELPASVLIDENLIHLRDPSWDR